MKIKCQVMLIDGKPNKNKRIYTNEAVENILNTWKEHRDIIFGMDEENPDYKLMDICGKVDNVYLEGNIVVIEGELFDNHNGTKILKQLREVGLNMYITTTGHGILSEDGKTVKDFELYYFNLTNDSSFDVYAIQELLESN